MLDVSFFHELGLDWINVAFSGHPRPESTRGIAIALPLAILFHAFSVKTRRRAALSILSKSAASVMTHFPSAFLPAFKLSKFKIALKTRK